MNQSLAIFMALFKRDIYAQRHHLKDYIINYCFIYPLICMFVFGYLQTHMFFDDVSPQKITTLLTGNALLLLMIISYKHHIRLLFDLEGDRFIEYQITLLNPRFVLLERILFTALLTFFIALPFYPLAQITLGNNFDSSATIWPAVFLILFLGSCVCSAFNNFIACFLTSTSQLTHVWPRCNEPMAMLGGFWVPCYVIWQFAPALGYLTYLNPMLYITDGLRQAVLGGQHYLPLHVCIPALICFFFIFVILAWYYFKKRIDHI